MFCPHICHLMVIQISIFIASLPFSSVCSIKMGVTSIQKLHMFHVQTKTLKDLDNCSLISNLNWLSAWVSIFSFKHWIKLFGLLFEVLNEIKKKRKTLPICNPAGVIQELVSAFLSPPTNVLLQVPPRILQSMTITAPPSNYASPEKYFFFVYSFFLSFLEPQVL